MKLSRAAGIGVMVGAMVLAALPALADGGADEDWVPAMNQESYWEGRFGPGATCTKYEGHNGHIPGRYEAAVIKDGTQVRVYEGIGGDGFQAKGPVNPANGQHHQPPHSWVMKCDVTQVTTTTQATTTTTVQYPDVNLTSECVAYDPGTYDIYYGGGDPANTIEVTINQANTGILRVQNGALVDYSVVLGGPELQPSITAPDGTTDLIFVSAPGTVKIEGPWGDKTKAQNTKPCEEVPPTTSSTTTTIPLDFDASGYGDCDGWYITNESDTKLVAFPVGVVVPAGETVFIADNSNSTERKFELSWMVDGEYVYTEPLELTRTLDDCGPTTTSSTSTTLPPVIATIEVAVTCETITLTNVGDRPETVFVVVGDGDRVFEVAPGESEDIPRNGDAFAVYLDDELIRTGNQEVCGTTTTEPDPTTTTQPDPTTTEPDPTTTQPSDNPEETIATLPFTGPGDYTGPAAFGALALIALGTAGVYWIGREQEAE